MEPDSSTNFNSNEQEEQTVEQMEEHLLQSRLYSENLLVRNNRYENELRDELEEIKLSNRHLTEQIRVCQEEQDAVFRESREVNSEIQRLMELKIQLNKRILEEELLVTPSVTMSVTNIQNLHSQLQELREEVIKRGLQSNIPR